VLAQSGCQLPKSNRPRATHDRLIGRRRELAQVERLLADAEAPYPRVLQITGESGIGKTRLLSYVAEQAGDAGYLVLSGRAAEFDTDEPFGVFLDALDQSFGGRRARALENLDDEHAGELASVFPTLAAHMTQHRAEPPARPGGVGMDRYRLHRAVAALLDGLAAGRPILLSVDDLHWADPASVELLLYLLRRPPGAPLFVAVAFRSRQLQSNTAAVLQQAQRDSRGELIELSPLSAQEASALLPAELPSAVAERIYSDSGGNPFYLQELIRALASDAQAAIEPLNGDPGRVPPTVTAVIASEFDRLAAQGRELIQAASVLGEQFEPELAREIVAMDAAEAVLALDELVDRDLVQAAQVPGLFRFRHPIVRRAVYESAKGGWRRAAHARAAEVLSARGAAASTRARHVERSASLGDGEAIAVLTEAGAAAGPRAPAAAAGWYSAALRLLPEQHDAAQRLELTLAIAVSLGSAGKLRESRNAFQEVLALLPPDPELQGSAVAAAALIEHLLGKHDEAQGLLLSALSGLDDRSAGAGELKLGIAVGCFFSADWSGMRYWAQKASENEGSPILEAGANAAMALAEYGLGNVAAAREHATRAAAVADRLSDSDWAPQLQSICLLGWAEYCGGRFDEAERHMSRALTVSQTTGQEHLSAAMLVVAAMSNLAVGRLSLASEQAETAIDTSLLAANDLFLTWALTVRCMVEIDCGSPMSAVRYGQKALEAGIQSRSRWSSVATLYLAEAWLEAGEPERFRKELFAGQSAPLLPPFLFYAVHAYELLTRAELELGLSDAARRWADQASEVAEALGLDGPSAEAQRAQATLMLSMGSFADAARAAQASAEQAERAGQPIQAARSRLLSGIALGRAGDAEAAVEQLRRAEQTFAAHGTSRYRDQAARELRQLGVHVSATRGPIPAQAGLGALSKRELTIAQLVHEGRTNRQIAEQLSISLKTVENHLAKIFRRLDISSRSQLATLVERSRGLAA
jgi:ATP/maltotriose-dependent transcriptional regulator MalT